MLGKGNHGGSGEVFVWKVADKMFLDLEFKLFKFTKTLSGG